MLHRVNNWCPLVASVALVASSGCGMEPANSAQMYLPDEAAAPQFVLPDGTTGAGWAQYQMAVSKYLNASQADQAAPGSGGALGIDFSPAPLFNSPQTGALKVLAGSNKVYIPLPLTNYGIRVDYASYKLVRGCINRSGPTVNLMFDIKNRKSGMGPPLMDFHLITYVEDHQRCYGIYDSGSVIGYCDKSCGSGAQGLKTLIYNAAIAVGAASGVARAVEEVAEPAVETLLVF